MPWIGGCAVKDLLKRSEVEPGQLIENPRNPRLHGEDQLGHLCDSLRRFGQTRPILVRAENRMVIAGHGVLAAAKRVGMERVDILLWTVDQETADSYMLADNRLSDLSTHDLERTAALLSEIARADYSAVGFTDAEVADLLGDVGDDIDVVEIETSDVEDRFWISVRGPLVDQARALARLSEYMAELPDVEVELGTVSDL